MENNGINNRENTPIVTLADLVEYSNISLDNFQPLPLCHTTNLNAVRSMLQQGHMKACDADPQSGNFSLFFFYGRAQYIPEEDVKVIYKRTNPPIVFLFDLDKMPHPHCMVPFDSGGYKRFEIEIDIKEFTIFIGIEGNEIKKFVRKVYTENENYLQRMMTIDPGEYPWCTPLKSLAKLHTTVNDETNDTNYGNQACTLEIQYKEDLPLSPLYVFLPAFLLTHPEGRKKVLRDLKFTEDDIEKKVFTYTLDQEIIFLYKTIIDDVEKKIKTYIIPKTK